MLHESNRCTLTVYKSKPNKKVLVPSTKHKHVKIDNTYNKRLPETVSFVTTLNLESISLIKWHESIVPSQVPEGGRFKFFFQYLGFSWDKFMDIA